MTEAGSRTLVHSFDKQEPNCVLETVCWRLRHTSHQAHGDTAMCPDVLISLRLLAMA